MAQPHSPEGPESTVDAAARSDAPGATAPEHSPAPSAGSAPAAVKDKTIGQVLSHLDADFPGLTASKVRFLEDQGLVTPERTATGYRKYSLADIQRLRLVLTLQRDQYLPLKVIKDKVDRLDAEGPLPDPESSEAEASTPSALPGPLSGEGMPTASLGPFGEAESREQARFYTMRELARRASVSLPMLRELIGYGLITANENGDFDAYALTVVRLCARLTTHGIGPRHLRLFRAAADREVGLVQQTVAPMASRRDDQSRERAAETARELSVVCLQLHQTLVAEQVHRNNW